MPYNCDPEPSTERSRYQYQYWGGRVKNDTPSTSKRYLIVSFFKNLNHGNNQSSRLLVFPSLAELMVQYTSADESISIVADSRYLPDYLMLCVACHQESFKISRQDRASKKDRPSTTENRIMYCHQQNDSNNFQSFPLSSSLSLEQFRWH